MAFISIFLRPILTNDSYFSGWFLAIKDVYFQKIMAGWPVAAEARGSEVESVRIAAVICAGRRPEMRNRSK